MRDTIINTGDIMLKMTDLILNSILIFFPMSVYVNYLEYVKKNEEEEKNIILNILLTISLYLIITYDNNPNHYSLLFYNIPIIVALLKKEKKLFLILFAITLTQAINISNIVLILYIIQILVGTLILCSNKLSNKTKQISFFCIEFIFLIFTSKKINLNNIICFIVIILIEILIIIIISKIINKKQNNVEINSIVKELEREKLLRSSISKLTHELKNPIAVCKGYLEMMDLKDSVKTKKYLSIITEEIDRSKSIMDEFSAYGKLKKLELEEMDLSMLLEDISNILLPIFKEQNAVLKIPKINELYIIGDYHKLKQVIINLLKNTIEAKKEYEPLLVQIKIKENKQSISISVIDNGIGMTEEVLSKVSEVFYTTKKQGTGLGLAFSKEVIELHKGTLKIKSEQNKGTEIYIRLPKEKKSEDFNNRNY